MKRIYIDLGNSGFSITVDEEEITTPPHETLGKIPVLNINGYRYGHTMGNMKIRLTPERLKELGEFLISESENSKEYYDNENEDNGWGGLTNSKFTIKDKKLKK